VEIHCSKEMTKEIQLSKQLFFDECKNSLGFLTNEYGFSAPEAILHKEVALFDTIFYKRKVAVECTYDIRDKMPSLYIVKLEAGKKPDCYRVNKKGEVVREYLTALLMARGVRDLKLDIQINDQNLPQQQIDLREYLLGNAKLLRLYGKDILNDSTDIFNYISPDKGDRF